MKWLGYKVGNKEIVWTVLNEKKKLLQSKVKMHNYLGAVPILLLCLSPSSAYLDGAREESCYNHSIFHRANLGGFFQYATTATCSPCSYELVVILRNDTGDLIEVGPMEEFEYSPRNTYTFELRATVNGYLGFLIQARYDNGDGVFDPSSPIVGTWDSGSEHRPLHCRENMTSIGDFFPNSATHANAELFRGKEAPFHTTMEWTAPSKEDPPAGKITFWYTIVQQLLNDFHPVAGPIGILVEPTSTPIPTPTMTKTPTTTTVPSTTIKEVQNPSEIPIMMTKVPTTTEATTTTTSIRPPGLSSMEVIGIGVGAGVGVVLLIVVIVLAVVVVCVLQQSKKEKAKPSRVSVLWTTNPTPDESGNTCVDPKVEIQPKAEIEPMAEIQPGDSKVV